MYAWFMKRQWVNLPLGKQNIQAKEAYFNSIFLVTKGDISCKSKHGTGCKKHVRETLAEVKQSAPESFYLHEV